jgi:hypothetical protein
MAAKIINDRKREQVKARKDSFINGNRKERRACCFRFEEGRRARRDQ